MDNYLDSFREMISLRGLTAHTLKNYCTYIRAYLDYLSSVLRKLPEDVSWTSPRRRKQVFPFFSLTVFSVYSMPVPSYCSSYPKERT